jgi:hypothetical protein
VATFGEVDLGAEEGKGGWDDGGWSPEVGKRRVEVTCAGVCSCFLAVLDLPRSCFLVVREEEVCGVRLHTNS